MHIHINILFLFTGFYSQDDVDDLLVESLKMKQLNHSNVMTLEGVCLDAGPAPFIVLPYMAGICYFSYVIYIQFSKEYDCICSSYQTYRLCSSYFKFSYNCTYCLHLLYFISLFYLSIMHKLTITSNN